MVQSRRIVWEPAPDAWTSTRMGRFLTTAADRRGLTFPDYASAWEWSVQDLEGFWQEVVDQLGVRFVSEPSAVLESRTMPGARWFPGGTLNYSEHALRHDGAVAIVGESQSRGVEKVSYAELRQRVARCAAGLRRLGVTQGDHVAAYLPNTSEAIVGFLATASLGAVWSSCAPEFGVAAVLDRFQQIEPKVLMAVTGYRYGARTIDRRDDLEQIRAGLPSVTATVVVDLVEGLPGPDEAVLPWTELLAVPAGDSEPDLTFTPVPFDHPLYVLYSSGSTGLPKPIVHGHGGILVEHLKMLALHHDMDERDSFFWFTTTGWMMWNYLVSGLLVGARVLLFDGDPAHPGLDELWRFAARHEATVVGLGAPFLVRCHADDLDLPADIDLSRVRQIGSTGAPLPDTGFEWVESRFGPSVQLASVSGGTDLCTAFVGGSPLVPVRLGEIQCRCLGADVDAFDEDGNSVVGSLGEMVIRAPMPSMPVGFHGDDGSRYRAAYFERYPGVWHHGDWLEVTEQGGCVITGRSDATLNRGGIRSGTAEYYTVVESIDGVRDSLVVHLEDPAGGPGEIVLLLVTDGRQVDDGLLAEIRTTVRGRISPRHVPDRVVEVPAIPRTISGKKVEVPVKRLLAGGDAARVVTRDALADPAAWDRLVEVLADAT
jgi:acetoacetyl-CoA synthetase